MQPTPVSSAEPADSTPPALGELIVQNGRLRGTRRPLTSPLTLLGQDPACEVCLNIEGVNPLHCLLVRGPDGFLLRDLDTAGGTQLNGQPIQVAAVQHGDVIAVGPFQFRLECPPTEPAEPLLNPETLQAEREALRIQAAAVVAQQAGLTEEENQLRQRRKALKRQKDQLAAHLEDRRRQLLQLQEQTRQDRAALQAEGEAARRETEELRAALTQELQAAQVEHGKVARERRWLVELRKRLKQRWRRHWQGQEAALEQRARELTAARARLEQDAAAVERERVALTQARLRFNGDAELGRRQLQEQWQQLGLAQQQWEACLNQEKAERARAARELERRAAAVSAAEQALAEQKRLAEQQLFQLRKEADGLDARIRNQRQKLLEQGHDLGRPRIEDRGSRIEGGTGVSPVGEDRRDAGPTSGAGSAERDPRSSILDPRSSILDPRSSEPVPLLQLIGDLADQRVHLLEQWRNFLEVCDAWQPERGIVLGEIEATGQQLLQREQRLQAQEQALAASMAELRRRQQALGEVRCSLEAWQARLTARETALESERVLLLAEVQAREEQAEAQSQRLEELYQRRAQRRGEEIEAVRLARTRHEDMRRDYALLWQECLERRAELVRQQREQAARSLALEQFRQELLSRAANTPGADKRLERLRRRSLARLEAEERDLTRQRESLTAETKRLEARTRQLTEQEQSLSARHEEWVRQQTEWEDQQAVAADLEQRRQQELKHLQVLHEQDSRQLADLREEVERIARLLLDETENSVPSASQAA